MSGLDPNGGGALVVPGGGGGGGATVGLLSALPVSPTVGQSYLVSLLDPTSPGAVFTCYAAGVWTPTRGPAVRAQGALHAWALDEPSGVPLDRGSDATALSVVGSWTRPASSVYRGLQGISIAAPAGFDRLEVALPCTVGQARASAVTVGALGDPQTWAQGWLLVFYNPAVNLALAGVYLTGAGAMVAATGDGAGVTDTSLTPVTVDWTVPHRLLLTYTGGTLLLYCDGVQIASVSMTAAATTVFAAGGVSGGAGGVRSTPCVLRDLLVWGTARTLPQVAADYRMAMRAQL